MFNAINTILIFVEYYFYDIVENNFAIYEVHTLN